MPCLQSMHGSTAADASVPPAAPLPEPGCHSPSLKSNTCSILKSLMREGLMREGLMRKRLVHVGLMREGEMWMRETLVQQG